MECGKPKIGPKPAIACKPKNIPPVKVRAGPPAPPRRGPYTVETSVKYDEYSSSYVSEKCDKFSGAKKIAEPKAAPPSPSTVCCSILSNASADCCGIINVHKKGLNGAMTKIDSLDSTSSDSGGFKDFVQLDLTKDAPGHQRKASQPEFLHKPHHQRTTSDCTPKPAYNAQALAQFLPQTEQKILQHKVAGEESALRQQIAKFNTTQKTEEARVRPKPAVISHSQFQQSTRKLEELLAQRLESGGSSKAKIPGGAAAEGSHQESDQKMLVQKQKLQVDLQQTVKQIQEIQSIELRLPQNRKWSEVGVVFNCRYIHTSTSGRYL